jgi:hypothetical protein
MAMHSSGIKYQIIKDTRSDNKHAEGQNVKPFHYYDSPAQISYLPDMSKKLVLKTQNSSGKKFASF